MAKLILQDGSCFTGELFGARKSVAGEVVFNTGMVGYPESLTDPSYCGQILVLTYPLIGNYGVPGDTVDEWGLLQHFESQKVQISALVVAGYSEEHSHWNSQRSLAKWLEENDIPGIYGVDTRLLTKKLRNQGTMLGKVVVDDNDTSFVNPNIQNLVAKVSTPEVKTFGSGDTKIIAIDCGIKSNIIRYFLKQGVCVKLVPWDYDFLQEDYDGIFVSNGPGNPENCVTTIENLRCALQQSKPILGICLGSQLLALAAGGSTEKLKYGHRGQNQPCIHIPTGHCYITPQNHGYFVSCIPEGWSEFFVNANDNTNEGLIHNEKPFLAVQFHPEAKGGPTDTEFIFDMFLRKLRNEEPLEVACLPQPSRPDVKKVLVIGSGGLSIGQAGEFDYSGSQAIKALKEEGLYTILVNPNIATIQTSKGLADKVYFYPITCEFIIQIIERERPDGILLTFGGQTALNCGIQLYEQGVFEKFNVQVLGTSIETIIATEDRDLFAKKLEQIDVNIAQSTAVNSVEEAIRAANDIGYPVIVRAAYALGGLGSGFAQNDRELEELAKVAFSMTSQVLVERSMQGWKEIEYEVVRDAYDNCITVCNMENFDPLGIHTGDSIVVAPSQTLSNDEYHKLRAISLKVIRHLGVVGECNIQFALDSHSENYCVIEVNARLSRSSALASKATGYPLAFVAAKLALGKSLVEIKNSITQETAACFEPSLDYVVVKFPKWDLTKFHQVSNKIGSAMKSVGEVMAIGRNFEEAIQKAIRMVESQPYGLRIKEFLDIEQELQQPSEHRIFAIATALYDNKGIEYVYEKTKIDRWFLSKLQNIIDFEKHLRELEWMNIDQATLLRAKQLGFSDVRLSQIFDISSKEVRRLRKANGIIPVVKQIDTLAAEYPAKTNYLFMTYNGLENDTPVSSKGIIVLGSGTYRIGSSVEFDWCAVSCIRTLRKHGYKNVMINYNPETVSTDYDECDRLYFEELSLERVLDIYERECAAGIILSVGGQIPNNLAIPLFNENVKVLGTHPRQIDQAENRYKFSQLLDSLSVDQPQWKELSSISDAQEFGESVGYPVLVRPSYVLSGSAMNVAYNSKDLEGYLQKATMVSADHPVVVSKFISDAKEIEMDAVANKGELVAYAISEHIENAGVHSGDATLVLPAQNLYIETIRRIRDITRKIARHLNISGPFNIQYLAKDNSIKVIECNLRSSRTFPFVSKTLGVNFIDLATRVMLGEKVEKVSLPIFDLDYVCIKAPQFSFTRLHGADPILGVEMASTGEVACFGENRYEAFLKALLSTGFRIPKKNILLSTGPMVQKLEFLDSARKLQKMGFKLFASAGTAKFLSKEGIETSMLHWPLERDKQPNIHDYLTQGKIDLVINIPKSNERSELTNGYLIRRTSVDFSVSLITNIKCAKLFVESLWHDKNWPVKSWDEYIDRR
ncbi:carbamoyl-phosphate synthase (glutamine-hydrolyzing) large subunit [Candidatus Uabimicrobium amorphum]|uniref:Carbamoyl phosphate synthase small chain n=1 Tax=Uabimicrobium amorphum TaxID=2596890 RepID=A0A5S9IQB8_UABAM|nr:carbamoyl-phosphate synthase (glutamine-hydrolyzing) large subunit [Candidatus Uabimicrobium amorphum]BBM85200.1 carbamoyl-phosphate synthase(glutamine-hydrolyzing) [Candidatus Uabimicrobium amorphum]